MNNNNAFKAKSFIGLLIAFISGVLFIQSLAGRTHTYFLPKIVEVIDGDTIKVDFSALRSYPPLNIVSIRIRGIDTPESYRPKCDEERELGLKAKQFVVDLIGSRSIIRVSDYEWGKFGGRIVGRVSVKGKDIATELINAGLAVKYHGGTKTHSWCE